MYTVTITIGIIVLTILLVAYWGLNRRCRMLGKQLDNEYDYAAKLMKETLGLCKSITLTYRKDSGCHTWASLRTGTIHSVHPKVFKLLHTDPDVTIITQSWYPESIVLSMTNSKENCEQQT